MQRIVVSFHPPTQNPKISPLLLELLVCSVPWQSVTITTQNIGSQILTVERYVERRWEWYQSATRKFLMSSSVYRYLYASTVLFTRLFTYGIINIFLITCVYIPVYMFNNRAPNCLCNIQDISLWCHLWYHQLVSKIVHRCTNCLIMNNFHNTIFGLFGPHVYPTGSSVIALVCSCVPRSVCVRPSLNISEIAH